MADLPLVFERREDVRPHEAARGRLCTVLRTFSSSVSKRIIEAVRRVVSANGTPRFP